MRAQSLKLQLDRSGPVPRLKGGQLVMTQELIANMLGVRREGVTEGAHCQMRTDLAASSGDRPTGADE
jgi:hypothetical protein